MAPVKFGLFKARSRDQQEQPSTENLLQSSHSIDQAGTPSSPLPSTSKGLMTNEDLMPFDFAILNMNEDDDDTSEPKGNTKIDNEYNKVEDIQINYQQLQNQSLTSMSTLDEIEQSPIYDEPHNESTSIDANSSQFDVNSSQFDVNSSQFDVNSEFDANSTQFDVTSQFDDSSIAPSEDMSVHCAMLKKPKKSRSKEQQLRDIDMWHASNIEVMQNLLTRSGTLDEKIKWEAIATARGLCTLTDSCACADCTGAKFLAGVADGDGGLGAAPLLSAVSVGCCLQ